MSESTRIVVTYHHTTPINPDWDRGVEAKLRAAFGSKVVATGSGYDVPSHGRDLCYEVKPGTTPEAVRKVIRQFFRSQRATNVSIEIYRDDMN